MHKILLGHPVIGSYSAFLFLGIFGGYLISRWRGARAGVPAAHIDNLALLVAVFSLFGARFFSWLFYFPPGVSLWRALNDTGGGMVFYGGFIFGALTILAYARSRRLGLGNLLDVFAPGLALGLALGRVGCYMAGCCWGDVCLDKQQLSPGTASVRWQIQTVPAISPSGFPLAVRFPAGTGALEQHKKLGLVAGNATISQPVHPVQLYEAAMAFGLCLYLNSRFRKRRWSGEIVCLLILNYSIIRFLTEFLRADNAPIYGGLTLSQVISLSLGVPCAILLWAVGRKQSTLFSAKETAARIVEQETQGNAAAANPAAIDTEMV
jgi:phosphatidylglycerol:prolipoprotein diacylglycerol transferase